MLDDLTPGQVLGRYELLLPVAQGGMASVWAARLKGSRGFQKMVAIKTMLPGLGQDPAFEKMFLDEASLASQVRHPHVIEILDLGEQDHVLYIVMEWVDGEPINIIMKYAALRSGIPIPIAAHIVAQACRGLHAAHELRDDNGALVGLVHRDVSPQNVLVTYDGVVKVVDFGVAKATSRASVELTAAGQLKGKIAYMSPEQLRSERIDRRTDVFAMGILLYMMTTGRHPFRGDDEAATVRAILSDSPAPLPSSYLPSYPATLEQVVMMALAKDPAKRYATANDMLVALYQALPPSLRSCTDDQVADYLRALLPERLEKRKAAIKSALDAAFRREHGRTIPLISERLQESGASKSGASKSSPPRPPTYSDEDTLLAPESSVPGATAHEMARTSTVQLELPEPRRWISRGATATLIIGVGSAVMALLARGPALRGTDEAPELPATMAAAPATGVPENAAPAPKQAPAPTSASTVRGADEAHPLEDLPSDAEATTVSTTSDAADAGVQFQKPELGRRATSKRAERTTSETGAAAEPVQSATSRKKKPSTFVSPIRDPGF